MEIQFTSHGYNCEAMIKTRSGDKYLVECREESTVVWKLDKHGNKLHVDDLEKMENILRKHIANISNRSTRTLLKTAAFLSDMYL